MENQMSLQFFYSFEILKTSMRIGQRQAKQLSRCIHHFFILDFDHCFPHKHADVAGVRTGELPYPR